MYELNSAQAKALFTIGELGILAMLCGIIALVCHISWGDAPLILGFGAVGNCAILLCLPKFIK